MKNKLSDLTNHLFAQVERLNDESLSDQDLNKECKRAEAISKVASNIIGIANVALQAKKLVATGNISKSELPTMLIDNKDTNGS